MFKIQLLLVLAQHLGAHDGVVDVEHAVKLLHGIRLALQVENNVDALVLLVDRVLEATIAPNVDLLQFSLRTMFRNLSSDGATVRSSWEGSMMIITSY